ncbi:YopJ family acetyltransferase [Xenorhabdus sp. PB62.4]|uniref:YopJ family acetyltransferase n=1 Tax=Xenorhabdus sp. PB62.4 TaxID=1851573 RepID=UPI001657447A|nr:YopJ family acetyltransferase [Xenorhabdus sp. PB62.4]MBC8954085.1 type III secretion system effector VopA, acetyltransferase [Xenorhabdus sp. PB62.4]
MYKGNLTNYINEINVQKQSNFQFNNIYLDQKNAIHILKYFNRKYAMNAHEDIIDDMSLFENVLDLPAGIHKRYIIKTDTAMTGVHFAALNIFKDSKENTSLIFVDASNGKNQFIPLRMDYLINENKYKDTIKILYIYSQIQNSPGDCLIFCLHFLKKMHKYAKYFSELHQKIFNDEIQFTNTENPIFFSSLSKGLPDTYCKKYKTVFFDQAINLLPIDFFKHAHSLRPLNAYLDRHPDETEKKVNKYGIGEKKGETLPERYKRHLITRTIDGKSRNYSTSIEEKRLSLAEAALKWLDEYGE